MCSHGDPQCGKSVLRDGLCVRHLKQKCLVCLEPVSSTNTINSKRLVCGHSFHPNCIMNWFVTSDECPVCRAKQPGDSMLEFKEKVEDALREKYKDAIDSLEGEVQALKETLRLQSMFVNARFVEPDPGPDETHRRVMQLLAEATTEPRDDLEFLAMLAANPDPPEALRREPTGFTFRR